MSKLKFRVWDLKHGGKLAQVRGIDFMEDGTPFCVHYCERDEKGDEYRISLAPDVFKLMQFTGLTDKNGNEIYEGDIFQDEEDGSYDFVEWSEVWCGWTTGQWFGSRELAKEAPNLEVTGNVYENPELVA